MGEINTTDLLQRIKDSIVKLSAAKTRVQLDDLIFEFTGELAEGTELSLIEGEFGEKLTLEDGTVLEVKEGKVASLSTVEASDEEEADEEELEEESLEDDDDELEEDDEELIEDAEVEERLAQLEGFIGSITERIDTLESLLNETTALNEELTSQVEKLSKEPAVKTKKETVKGTFNKTQSRAAQILSRVSRDN